MEIHRDHLIPYRSPDVVFIYKKGTYKLVDFALSTDDKVKKKKVKIDKYLALARPEKAIKHKGCGDTNCNRCLWKRQVPLEKTGNGLKKRRDQK